MVAVADDGWRKGIDAQSLTLKPLILQCASAVALKGSRKI